MYEASPPSVLHRSLANGHRSEAALVFVCSGTFEETQKAAGFDKEGRVHASSPARLVERCAQPSG